ncbi:hypothetical protein Scep_028502 [Stephania cephalantha]|uniref:Peptidase S26 domain-containing protein n=1 Tax=Stephania cephalantha TaxID=152367 RepID=A0AAP0EC69_9MAGN
MGLAIRTLPWKTIAKEALNRTLPFTNLLCCLHITNTYLFTPALVVGPSMVPTFSLTGDLVLAERLSPRRGTVGKGDIVLVRSPENPRKVITKRVVAVEGEAVGGGGVVVPKGCVWIVGDNVGNSRDSRHFGAVPVGLVVGRVFWRVAPWEGFGPGGSALGVASGSKDGLSCPDKKAAVHAEMERVNKLPAHSSYATHRIRVLNKLLQLLSIQVIEKGEGRRKPLRRPFKL